MDLPGYRMLIGTGGIGTGLFFDLVGDHTLGREESREGLLLEARDFCKLHIIAHYVAVLLCPDHKVLPSFGVLPIGKVGADQAGENLLAMMKDAGMGTGFVKREQGAATLFSVCFQYPDRSGGNITTARSASHKLTPEDIRRAEPLFQAYRGRGIALGAPETALESRLALLELGTENSFFRFCALNSAEVTNPTARELIKHTDVISLNRDEAETLVGDSFDPLKPRGFLTLLEETLLTLNPAIKVCLTIGLAGAYGFDSGAWEFTPAAPVEAKSTAGAGDATLAGLIVSSVLGLPFVLPDREEKKSTAGKTIESALDFAALLASYSVLSVDTINLETSRKTLLEHGKKLGVAFSEPVAGLLGEEPGD